MYTYIYHIFDTLTALGMRGVALFSCFWKAGVSQSHNPLLSVYISTAPEVTLP